MFWMAIALTLLLTLNIGAVYFWFVKRIDEKGYGRGSRAERRARMMPVVDRTVVVEHHADGTDSVRTISPTPGATAGGTA